MTKQKAGRHDTVSAFRLDTKKTHTKVMKHNFILLTVSLLLGAGSTAFADGYTKQGNTVTIAVSSPQAKGAKTVRLQVVNDKIIRVVATPEDKFPEKQSLIVVKQPEYNAFTVTENGGDVIVKTDDMSATVNKADGRVTFRDEEGRILLSEAAEGGKVFTPFRVPDREIGIGTLTEKERNAWSWQMKFDSPDDEAFYGLGQHQAGELNIKGKNEDLFQYNTKVSVPFVVSNRGYGLLWDSYSYCRLPAPSSRNCAGRTTSGAYATCRRNSTWTEQRLFTKVTCSRPLTTTTASYSITPATPRCSSTGKRLCRSVGARHGTPTHGNSHASCAKV